MPLVVAPVVGCDKKIETSPVPSGPASTPVMTSAPTGSDTPAASAATPIAPSSSSPTAATAGPTASTGTGQPPLPQGQSGRVIDYGQGVEIRSDADLAALHGAPQAFKDFIRAKVAEAKKDVPDPGCNAGIAVQMLRTDGYAVGSTFGCGGAMEAWAAPQGKWTTIWGGQSIPDCVPFTKVAFPADVFGVLGGQCLEGGKPVAYKP